MRQKLNLILERMHQYNSEDMAYYAFRLDKTTVYDVLEVAPSFTPYSLKMDEYCRVTTLKEGLYTAGYLVEKDGLKIAWIKIGSSDSNCIDHIAVCAELQFKRMIFVGVVGALKPDFSLGDICTPSYSIAGGYANIYLEESIRDYVSFEKVYPPIDYVNHVIDIGAENGIIIRKASVFCTASIALEYYHLDEIKAFDTDLIEMETAVIYQMAELLEVPSVALLVISDNSATGAALVGRTEEDEQRYNRGKKQLLPEMILLLTCLLLLCNSSIKSADYWCKTARIFIYIVSAQQPPAYKTCRSATTGLHVSRDRYSYKHQNPSPRIPAGYRVPKA